MADDSSGTNSTLAFIVGGLVVAVGVQVFFLYGPATDKNDLNIKIDIPEVTTPKSGG